ncbi:uncharacterized protein LOC144099065 isoform X2 [Amblyomma americanum]
MAEYHVASRQHCGSGNVVGGNVSPVEFPCGSPRLQVDRTWSPSQVNNQGAESGTIAAARINITITRGNFIYNVNPARHLYAPQRDCAERDC